VLNPTPGSRDLFFVAKGDGTHIFSETGAEHLEAVARVRASRAGLDSLAMVPLDPDLTAPVPGAVMVPLADTTRGKL
jgi:hypothetical protein